MNGQAPDTDALMHSFVQAMGIPFTRGNRIEPLINGREIFPAMLDAVAQSNDTIEFLTFVYWTGDIAQQFAAALAEAARRGVTVRVLLDAFGCKTMDEALVENMKKAGVIVAWFRPLSRVKFWENDHRTHRKVMVVDQRIGFTGGVGIAAEWTGDAEGPEHWRDTHFRVTGPAVTGLRAGFLGNWVEAGRPLPDDCLPPAPAPGTAENTPSPTTGPAHIQTVRSTASIRWSDAFILQRLAIRLAQRKLHVTTAYFVPHPIIIELLRDAADRGVEVHLLMPGPHTDERLCRLAGEDTFQPLLDAGVHLHIYQPTMLHAKIITVDDGLALLGSANFNQRSIQKDDEICLTVVDADLVRQLDEHFAHDLTHAKPIDLDDWQRRSLPQRAKEKAARLLRGEL